MSLGIKNVLIMRHYLRQEYLGPMVLVHMLDTQSWATNVMILPTFTRMAIRTIFFNLSDYENI